MPFPGAVAVGTGIAPCPPHRSRRAAFPHRAPAGSRAQSGERGRCSASPIRRQAAGIGCAGDDASLASGRALPLTRAGLPPAGSRQLRLAHDSTFSSLCGTICRPTERPLRHFRRTPRLEAAFASGRAPRDFKDASSTRPGRVRELPKRRKSLPIPSIFGGESGLIKALSATLRRNSFSGPLLPARFRIPHSDRSQAAVDVGMASTGTRHSALSFREMGTQKVHTTPFCVKKFFRGRKTRREFPPQFHRDRVAPRRERMLPKGLRRTTSAASGRATSSVVVKALAPPPLPDGSSRWARPSGDVPTRRG